MRELYVYILASKSGVLYVGVTNNLYRRLREHRTAKLGFTAAYRVHRLVYFEVIAGPRAAIAREKELKGWTRRKKLALVKRANPYLRDLAREWFEAGSGRAGRSRHPEGGATRRPKDLIRVPSVGASQAHEILRSRSRAPSG